MSVLNINVKINNFSQNSSVEVKCRYFECQPDDLSLQLLRNLRGTPTVSRKFRSVQDNNAELIDFPQKGEKTY